MPEDNELQIATVSGVIYPLNRVTQFQVVPPPAIEKIGSITSGSDQLTLNTSGAEIVNFFVFAEGIDTGTSVVSVMGNVATLSKVASATLSLGRVVFYVNAEDGLLPLQKGAVIRFL